MRIQVLYCHTFTFLLIISYSFGSFAQTEIQDVIYLKTGSYVRGHLIQPETDSTITVKLENGSVFQIRKDEIKEVKQEPRPYDVKSNWDREVKHAGFTNISEVYISFGSLQGFDPTTESSCPEFLVGLSSINGFTISPYIHFGLGLAVEKWKKYFFLPIFLDLRVNFMAQSATPFLYTDVGYAPGWLQGYSEGSFGGLIGGLGVGAKVIVGRKMAWTISLGYRFQQLKGWEQRNPLTTVKAVTDANFFAIRSGLVF